MGLFQKMSLYEAFALLCSRKSSKKDLEKATKIICALPPDDRRSAPYMFLCMVRSQHVGVAYEALRHEEDKGELSELMLSVLDLPVVFDEFQAACQSGTDSPLAAIYVARAYESGWGIEKNHEKAVEVVRAWGDVPGAYANEAEKIRKVILSADKPKAPAPSAAPEPVKNEDVATGLSDNKTENTTEGVLDALLNGDGLKEAFEKCGMMTFDSAIIRDLAYGLRDLREATGAKSAEELSEKQFVKYQDKLKRAFWAMDAAFWNAEASGSKGEKETVAKVLKSNYVFKLYYKLGFYADCAESCLYCALMKTLGIAEENYDVNFNDAKNLIEAAEKFGASPECITRYKEFVSYKSGAEKASSASLNADSFEKATPPAPATAPEPVKTEYKRIEFKSGAVYEGELHNGIKHGHGKYTWADGEYYDGDWLEGKRTGKGLFHYNSGKEYVGEFVDGEKEGHGRETYCEGNYYDGEWKNDKRNGKGTFAMSCGDIYEGEFVDDKMHGHGKYTSAKGWVYEGGFQDDSITGHGKIVFANGDCYEGALLNCKRHGTGKENFTSGRVYVGEYQNDKPDGKGKITYKDGTYYDGQWKDGKKHGHGVYTEKLGEYLQQYEGEFVDGKPHGRHIGFTVGGTSVKQYYQVYENGECVVPMSDITAENRNMTAEELIQQHRAYWRKSNAEIGLDEHGYPLPTATPHAAAPVSGHSDSEDEWESFDDIDDLLQKLKTPSLFADPRDRCIVNSCEYMAPFLKEAQEEFEGGDNGAVNEIIGSIFHITSMDLCDASFEWDKVVSHTSFESFLRSALYGLSGFDPEDPYDFLIPLANVVYYIWKYNPDNSWFEILCHVWVKLGGKVDENLLWFKRMRDCGDCNGTADDPIDESNFGEILDRHNYNMGSDCCLYEENPTAPGNSLYRYEPPEVDDEYKLEMVLEAVFNVGEYVEPGTMSADVFYNWIEGCKSFTFTEKNGRINSGRVTRGGNFSKRLSALRPLQDYISTAKHAIKCLRESVPADDCNDYEKSLEDYIYLANDALEGGLIDVAYDWYLQAYNHGYDTRRLGEICGNAVISTLQKEEHWSFYDSLVDIYKIAVFCYPEKYSDYFETLIADHDYPLGYITELLLNREYA